MKIINSAAYEDLCDHQILFINDLKKYTVSFELYKKDCIIYCKTDFTELLFEHLKFSKRKYILITHHSDYSINEAWFKLKPPNIIKWFAINPTYRHPELITIPAGIWTSEGRAYYQSYHKIEWFKKNMFKLRDKNKIVDKVYCNWSVNTNPYRKKILKELNVSYIWESGISFKDYCINMSSHKFIISPPGNGLDNHRTWEALYLGCIPIVIKNYIYEKWTKLPIIQVNNYSEVTKELLMDFHDREYNYEKLYIEYWNKKIRDQL